MFKFRLIDTPDGNQVIDKTLCTPYESLTAIQMMEYIEVDNQLAYMDRIEHKLQAKRKTKWYMRLAVAVGLF